MAVDQVVDTADGLFEATDITRGPVCYSCRNAACGSCFIEVDDTSLLEPPDDNELAVLHSMGATKENQRIACACKLKEDAQGTLRLKMGY